MTGRIQLIEKQLLAIGDAEFQLVCDTYLRLREKEISSFNKTGTTYSKKKTRKGTPDSFFRLKNGDLVFAEHTTQSENLIKKIKNDIDSCLDSKKVKIPLEEIKKVIICFNSPKLKLEDEREIQLYAKNKGIPLLELIGLELLAIDIDLSFPIIAKSYLGLPFDTGLILPIRDFIQEYNTIILNCQSQFVI